MGIEIGGSNAYKVKSLGNGVGLAFHWVREDPAMCFFPTEKSLQKSRAGVYILPIDELHRIVKPGTKGQGVDGAALFGMGETAAAVIGRGGDASVARTVADAILSNIDDLLKMPPEPEWLALKRQAKPIGEAQLIAVDRKTGDQDVIATREL